jgi:LacI family transcriptional regulator
MVAQRSAGHRRGIREVAAEAGVSISTVSNVLNKPHIVAPATRQRVEEVARRFGYVPNASARNLRRGGGTCVGAIFLDVGNPYYTEVARGMEDRLDRDETLLIVCSSDEQAEKERRYLRLLRAQGVQSILVTPAEHDVQEIGEDAGQTPIVLLDRPRPEAKTCLVHVSDVRGGHLAANHLLSLGHRRVAFINGPLAIHACADRSAGVRSAINDVGLDPADALVEVNTTLLNADGGESALEGLLTGARPPTAIFCVNDLVALGVLRGLRKRGLAVPDDVAVVGYDDVQFASMVATPLTSIRQPKYQLGWTAAELLLAEAAGDPDHEHQQIVFQPELVVRESSRPVRPHTVLLP